MLIPSSILGEPSTAVGVSYVQNCGSSDRRRGAIVEVYYILLGGCMGSFGKISNQFKSVGILQIHSLPPILEYCKFSSGDISSFVLIRRCVGSVKSSWSGWSDGSKIGAN